VNKKELLIQLQQCLQKEVNSTLGAVNEAHSLATHEQSKPENQYDTLALEAAYLAHGQSERIIDLQRQMIVLNHFELTAFTEETRIGLGALVCIKEQHKPIQWLWLVPVAGGQVLTCCETEVRTITEKAPLAARLIGRYLGDEIEIVLGRKKKQFEVIELL
jgi:transcription elongation GreA/GreB family factor